VHAGLWERAFSIAPLVIVGTREGDAYDFAPKHMAMPLGWEGFYCFVCSPRHATYRNVRAHPQFTVSVPRPEQVLESSFAAGARFAGAEKPALAAIPTERARLVDVPIVAGCAVALECELERIVDGFGPNSLIVGRVVAAAAARDALRGTEVDDADLVHRLGLLAYLAPGRFAVVRESFAFPYPLDYRL
jgi:flavin reductase (DIM6/NTAB) family NADH-FMN oxidoreductase RutF